jgi:hypothetical protein
MEAEKQATRAPLTCGDRRMEPAVDHSDTSARVAILRKAFAEGLQ